MNELRARETRTKQPPVFKNRPNFFVRPAPRFHFQDNLIRMLIKSVFVKIVVFAPVAAAAAVREAMGEVGAGKMRNYDFCSASVPATGRFRPLAGAKPAIGRAGEMTKVREEKIEAVCHKDKVKEVIRAIKRVHPYEEPAIDIMPRLEIK